MKRAGRTRSRRSITHDREIMRRRSSRPAAAERAEKDGRLTAASRGAALRRGSPSWKQEARTVQQTNSPNLEQMQQDGAMLNEEVGDEEIAGIVSKWTSVSRLQVARRRGRKTRSSRRAVAPNGSSARTKAVTAVATAVRRARAGLKDPDRPVGTLPLPRPDGRRQDRTGKALAETACSTTRRR